MKKQGIWVSPTEFVQFGEPSNKLSDQIATRGRSIDFYALGMYLPNPDPVLKALGKDIKVYQELRADAHVGGCIRRRKAAVKALEWGLDREKAKSRVAKNIEAIFADLPIERIITEMLDAVLYGYQPMEITWRKVGGLVVPVDIIGKPANWFVFDEENKLRFRTRENSIKGEELPERKFLLPRQDPTYDNPYGFPDLSMVFWPTTFKKGGLKFWVQFTEKYGAPWVIGKHPRGTQDKEADDLLDKLEAMVQDAVGVIPDDSSVEIKEAANGANNADVYERLLHFCRSEVSIALLGQNQTTEANSNRASAQAGLEVTRDIRDGDKAIVEEAFNALIRWVCELNFNDGARPVFEMWEQQEVDKVQAERDEILTRAGAKLTRAYFMRAYGLGEDEIGQESPSTVEGTPEPLPEDFAEGDPDYADTATPLLAAAAQPTLDDWLSRVRHRMAAASNLQQLQEDLLVEFAELDETELAKVMALAFACADLAGRTEVQGDA